ncbi:MAG: DUF5010 C-terminal domain-containing protein [Planctomycetaceae bacterium]
MKLVGRIAFLLVLMMLSWSDSSRIVANDGPETDGRLTESAKEDFVQPAWGQIIALPEQPQCYRFDVRQVPGDGKLAVPVGLPQIVRARMLSASGEPGTTVGVEFNADATEISLRLPSDGKGTEAIPPDEQGVSLLVETADRTAQLADGRILFTAREAEVVGDRAKLEAHPGNYRIGFWSNEKDSVRWKYQASRWGKYHVALTYSTSAADGTEIEIEFGGATLQKTLKSTGSWYRYATIDVGTMYLAASGETELNVRCLKKVGGAVMNLKGVILTPACEGTPPKQSDDGQVVMHSRDSTIRGTMLRYEPAEKKQTAGYWVVAGDAVTWEFSITKPGDYDIEVLQGCGTGQGGSEMRVTVDQQEQTFVVEETGHFQNFKPRIIGKVRLEVAGKHRLSIQPQRINKNAACDIRQVRLLPSPAS